MAHRDSLLHFESVNELIRIFSLTTAIAIQINHTPSANVTFVFNNPPTTGSAYDFTLKVAPSATVTLTWPSSVKWAGGTAPSAPASGQKDVYNFFTLDGGTTYYGFQAGDAMA